MLTSRRAHTTQPTPDPDHLRVFYEVIGRRVGRRPFGRLAPQPGLAGGLIRQRRIPGVLAMTWTLAVVLGACGSAATSAPSPNPSRSDVAASSLSAASATPSAVPTPLPSSSATAVAAFTAWLASPDLRLEAGVEGSEEGLVALYGTILVDQGRSYQLLTAEPNGGPVMAYERDSFVDPPTRTLGAPYAPAPASLKVSELFGAALATSAGWADLGLATRAGRSVHRLRAATSGLTDDGLFIDTTGGAIPMPPGQLEAWVQDDGTPVEIHYSSAVLDLLIVLQPTTDAAGFRAMYIDAWAHHASTAYGYAFDVPAAVTFTATADGETANAGVQTFCRPTARGANLAGWVADGLATYTSRWGKPASTIEAYGGSAPLTKARVPMAISTWTTSTSSQPQSIVIASFATKTHFCDLLMFNAPDAADADAAHAAFDRIILSLRASQ